MVRNVKVQAGSQGMTPAQLQRMQQETGGGGEVVMPFAVQPCLIYHNALQKLLSAGIDWPGGTIRGMLLVDGHTVDLATHVFVSDVVANEHAATGGYFRQDLTGLTMDLNGAQVEADSNPVSFGAAVTISARYLVLYQFITNDAASPIIFNCDLTGGGNASSDAGLFQISPSANGWHIFNPNQ